MGALIFAVLLLGWAVGANVAANVFATAVASRMVRFATAATLCATFIVIGGLVNGAAAMSTLGEVGAVDTLGAAIGVASASALAIAVMTGWGVPVSAAQSAVGALVGYQWVRYERVHLWGQVSLPAIVLAWISTPILAALAALTVYKLLAWFSRKLPMPLFLLDRWLRVGLVAVGCYGAWAFGGNNIANVVGFYTRLHLFAPVSAGLTQTRVLALLGGLGIALGVATSSNRVMMTVGRDLVKLDAVTATVAIFSEAVVLDFFSHSWRFYSFYLPAVPVSISQALVGSVLGLGLARGIQTIRLRVLGSLVVGWIVAPLLACLFAYGILRLLQTFEGSGFVQRFTAG